MVDFPVRKLLVYHSLALRFMTIEKQIGLFHPEASRSIRGFSTQNGDLKKWTWAERTKMYILSPSCLVGGIPTPLKNMSSSVGMIIPNIWNGK